MPKQNVFETSPGYPSVTSWTRIEPLPRDATMQRSLQAQICDPLFMLARQFQMGEFLGEDAGSPFDASMLVEFRTVTTYRPGEDDSKTIKLDKLVPIEPHVEREAVALRLRGSVQLGLYFESLILQDINPPDSLISAYRASFPIGAAPPDPGLAPADALTYRSLVAGKVTDGVALYPSVVTFLQQQSPLQNPPCKLPALNLQTPPPPLPSGSDTQAMLAVLWAFVCYRQALFTEPANDSPWQSTKLDYDFALGSPTSDQNLLLASKDFPGGHVDWYSFSMDTAAANDAAKTNPASVNTVPFDFLPNHVVFRGMPDPRWWNFEDSVTDFGQLDVDHVDLAKLLVIEFAVNYGNDWFSVPVPVNVGPTTDPSNPGASTDPSNPQGTLSRVLSLVVTDTFGVRTLIRPAEQTQVNPGEHPWSMFKLSGKNPRSDYIALLPTLGVVDDAPVLEDVLFLRDDMAAMAWAVERHLQGDLDSPLDAHEMYLQTVQPKQYSGPNYTPGGPEIYYTIEMTPPYNWIPLVPVQSLEGAPYLRRGALAIPDPTSPNGFKPLPAQALILEPNSPFFFVVDHAVSRAGRQVSRYFRRTRSFDGSTLLWIARKSGIGRGMGWSGLRFDLVRDIPKQPTA